MATKVKTTPAPSPAPATAPAPAPASAALVAAETTVPTADQATAVVDAAKQADAPLNDAEATDRALADSLTAFNAAAAAGAAEGHSSGSAGDGAEDEDEDEDEGKDRDAGDADPLFDPEFPIELRVFNHSSVSLAEKVSGAYLQAGGSAVITLADADHAAAVGKSLKQLADENFLSPSALVFTKA